MEEPEPPPIDDIALAAEPTPAAEDLALGEPPPAVDDLALAEPPPPVDDLQLEMSSPEPEAALELPPADDLSLDVAPPEAPPDIPAEAPADEFPLDVPAPHHPDATLSATAEESAALRARFARPDAPALEVVPEAPPPQVVEADATITVPAVISPGGRTEVSIPLRIELDGETTQVEVVLRLTLDLRRRG
jgi:hypothetical protein